MDTRTYLFCLLAIALCEGGRIRRGYQESLFPNFRSVYHGHGAISYQNVQIDNHGAVPIASNYVDRLSDLNDYSEHGDTHLLPIVEPQEDSELVEIHRAVPDEEVVRHRVDLEHDLSRYGDHYYGHDFHGLDYEH